MPDDRLSDVTIRHDALFGAAGTLSVHAGALTVVYTGSGPEDLMALLTHGPSRSSGGSGRGSPRRTAAAAAGTGMLRTLRLSARSMRFVAVRGSAAGAQQHAAAAVAAGGAAPQAGQQQQAQQQQVVAAGAQEDEVHSCSGAELFEYLSNTDWSSLWDVKLQRSMFRDQLTFSLARRATPAGTPGLPVPATV